MNTTQKQQIILLIDDTMDQLAVSLADVRQISQPIYAKIRDDCAARLMIDLNPDIDMTAQSAADCLDRKVADVIRGRLVS